MTGDVADVSKRLASEVIRAELVAAGTNARYRWAGPLVEGKTVLDAGCGLAEGTISLARWAISVVGVDRSQTALAAAGGSLPANVALQGVEDLGRLPFEPGRFDAVVCFDVLDFVDQPSRLIEGLGQALADDGLLIISIGAGHRVLADLEGRYEHVGRFRQVDWITSAIVGDPGPSSEPIELRVQGQPEDITADRGLVLLASHRPLPPPPPPTGLASNASRLWEALDASDAQERIIRSERDRANVAEAMLAERADLLDRLRQSEQELAQALREVARVRADFEASTSWRVTRPLRQATDTWRRLRSR